MIKGLSNTDAADRLKQHGYNELPSTKSKSVLHIAFEVMKEPMFLLLISCGALYMILGDYQEGSILLSTIFIIIFITFYQYQKTEKALEALRKMASPRALVMRNGKAVRIPGREVVPDDIILLNEGDRVPADVQLLESFNLSIDESLLTGESLPVTKSVQSNQITAVGQAFSGTLIIQGKGTAKVLSTGINTQFGKIGTSLQNIKQDETHLQKEMKSLIKKLFLIGVIISVVVFISFYLTRGQLIPSILNGLAAAMAILPEEFPVVLTVFLALGAWRLSKKNVLTRKPSAIETLGSATVLCSDKTGTITQNKMEIAALFNGNQLHPKGDFIKNRESLTELIETAHYASLIDSIDPMEKAIVRTYDELVHKKKTNPSCIKEYPLTKDLFALTRVIKNESDSHFTVCCKGAPEAIFGLCKLNRESMERYQGELQKMAEKGFRVLAVASASFQSEILPKSVEEFEFRILGLIGLEDPIRPGVQKAIQECKEAGIKVIMITGDYPITAKSIAAQIGMNLENKLLTGEEIKNMSDKELRTQIKSVNIFARVIPEQKLRIVQALKANHEIVAMTGDGVNDAPALKAAHIGIAMGNKGTDVAREASSLVLLDDNFASIVAAIRSGRKIFDNLQKAMSYIIAIHIPIIGLTLLPSFFITLPLLLMPLHIVFMELIIDPICSVAFESEQEEKGIMNRPPRDPKIAFFGGKKIVTSLLEGLLLLSIVILVYFLSIKEGHSEGEVRAIAFSTLIIGNIFLILTNLSKTRSIISVLTERNIAVLTILGSALIILCLIIYIPALQLIFSFQFPGYSHFIPSIASAGTMLLILEVRKYLFNRKENKRY